VFRRPVRRHSIKETQLTNVGCVALVDTIKNGFYVDITAGIQIVIKFDNPENLQKAYIRAVAKAICTELVEIASFKKTALDKKYAPERVSSNKELLKQVGKFSARVSN
jgi:hypothetical protein